MSFALTKTQFLDGSKDVTRRLGWANLKPGDHFMAVEKCMGLKKGEKIKKLGLCVCVSNNPTILNQITEEDCIREGFPELPPREFVRMFCRHMKCDYDEIVNRIEFRRVI